jgi:rare lipoprotein A
MGTRTASGERMNAGAMAAAHRTLPFGTKVKVENLANGRSVVVRINDRGPFSGGRIIDVTQGAAERLGMIRAGVVRVKVTVVEGGTELGGCS